MKLINLLASERGQSRILEAVIAASVIFMVFSVSSLLVRASDIRVLQERADLDRLGYNTLHKLVESGAFEDIMRKASSQPDEQASSLKNLLQRSLPQDIFFNLTVYRCETEEMNINISSLNITATNMLQEQRSLEISSTSLTYTSRNGDIYLLILILTRAGGS
ncbi:MAG: hypothetical protein QXH67_04665 [Candidatus Bathyarchaeia archaeon]